jgi:hypothetical protein
MIFGASLAASAQVNVYVSYGASRLNGVSGMTFLYGPTGGMNARLANLKRVRLSIDVRATSLDDIGGFTGSGQRLEGAGAGPMVSAKIFGFTPYAVMDVGYARYSTGTGNGTTDSQLDYNGGVERKLRGNISWRIFEYGYKQYFMLGGQIRPQSFSTGVVYSFGHR